jgi:hypothetical protein
MRDVVSIAVAAAAALVVCGEASPTSIPGEYIIARHRFDLAKVYASLDGPDGARGNCQGLQARNQPSSPKAVYGKGFASALGNPAPSATLFDQAPTPPRLVKNPFLASAETFSETRSLNEALTSKPWDLAVIGGACPL